MNQKYISGWIMWATSMVSASIWGAMGEGLVSAIFAGFSVLVLFKIPSPDDKK